MPGHVQKARKEFGHQMTAKHQSSPYPHVQKKYGAKVQYVPHPDQSPPINKEGKKFIEVCRKFLYLCQAVDLAILTALSALAAQ